MTTPLVDVSANPEKTGEENRHRLTVPPRSAVPCAQCPDPTLPLIEIPKWLRRRAEGCPENSMGVSYRHVYNWAVTFKLNIEEQNMPKILSKRAVTQRAGKYGWRPDLPDHRDLVYATPHPVALALPPSVDLRPKCPPVYDQGQLSSCTANAIAGAVEFDQIKLKLPKFVPSRLFIYYNERDMEHDVNSDGGAQIRDGIKSVAQQGVCPETLWPYNDQTKGVAEGTKCLYAEKPSPECYADAKKHTVKLYERLTPVLNTLKGCLASGYPFVCGITVYESFEGPKVAKTGIVPLPEAKEKMVGGHAVVAVGYHDAKQQFIMRNSWGPKWGLKGYFLLPYAYLTDTNLADDFWTIRTVL